MTRAEDAQLRADLMAQQAKSEAKEAQKFIDAFIKEARSRGIEPVPLKAWTMTGKRVKTNKQGWYLRQNHSLAIDTDGGYHVLVVSAGPLARWTGVTLSPTQPSLVVGRGGRDGETGYLREFLQWILEGRISQRD